MKKKVVCLLLTVCVLASGCGKKEEPVKEVEPVETQTVETQVESEEVVETETETEEEVELSVEELGVILSDALQDIENGFSIDYASDEFSLNIAVQGTTCRMGFGETCDLWMTDDYIYVYSEGKWIKGVATSTSEESETASFNINDSLNPQDMAQEIIDSFGDIESVAKVDDNTYTFSAVSEEEDYDEVEGTIYLNDDGTLNELLFEYNIGGQIVPASLTRLSEELKVPEEALNAEEVSEEEIGMAALGVMFEGIASIMPDELETEETSTETSSDLDENLEVTGDIP